AWMYRAGIESILGIRREGDFLVIDPCIPADWPGFEVTVNVASTRYEVRFENPSGAGHGIVRAVLDGAPVACGEGRVRAQLDGGTHTLLVSLGKRRRAPRGA